MRLLLLVLALGQLAEIDAARRLREEGKIAEALSLFEKLAAEGAPTPELWRELGHARALAGRYGEALAAYERLADADAPRWRIEGAWWTALTHLYTGALDDALAGLEKVDTLAVEAGDTAARVRALWYRGHVLTEIGRYTEATRAFVAALAIAPDNVDTLHLAGVMAARQGDAGSLRHQIEDLRQAVRQGGDPAQARRVAHLEAELALLRGEPDRALARLDEALRLFPHPLYREAVARARRARGDLAGAEEAYRAIVDATDERLDIPLFYVRALRELARVLAEQGRSEEAALYEQRFLEHWGGHPELTGSSDSAGGRSGRR